LDRRPERPRGERYQRRIGIRVPREMLSVLKRMARETDVSVGELIRECICCGLLVERGRLVQLIHDEERAGSTKLKAIKRIRAIQRTLLMCTAAGLRLARLRSA